MGLSTQDIRNCPRCGKIFVRVSRNLCPKCLHEEDEMITKVNHYLREHKGAALPDIIEATGADEALVLRLIREGRIIVSDAPSLKCERCGRPVTEGRFCNTCATELSRGLMSQPRPAAQPASGNDRGARVHIETRTKRDNTSN